MLKPSNAEVNPLKVLVKEFDNSLGEATVQSGLNLLMHEMKQKNFVVLDVDLKREKKKYTCIIKYESLMNMPFAGAFTPAAFPQ